MPCRQPLEGDEPQAAFLVLRIEIETVRCLAFRDDDRHRTLELLACDRGCGNLVDAVRLDVGRPARIGRIDAQTRIRCPPQKIDELVVVELDHLGARHDPSTLYVLRSTRKYRKCRALASDESALCRSGRAALPSCCCDHGNRGRNRGTRKSRNNASLSPAGDRTRRIEQHGPRRPHDAQDAPRRLQPNGYRVARTTWPRTSSPRSRRSVFGVTSAAVKPTAASVSRTYVSE